MTFDTTTPRAEADDLGDRRCAECGVPVRAGPMTVLDGRLVCDSCYRERACPTCGPPLADGETVCCNAEYLWHAQAEAARAAAELELRGGDADDDLRPGERVEISRTIDPFTRLRPGDRGTLATDGPGMAHGAWDSGSRLAMVLRGHDVFRRVGATLTDEQAEELARGIADLADFARRLSVIVDPRGVEPYSEDVRSLSSCPEEPQPNDQGGIR